MPGEYMTIDEAAKFLNLSAEAVRILAEKGITHKSENGKMFVKTDEISDWLNRRIKDLEPSALDRLEKDYREQSIVLSPHLDPRCVKTRDQEKRKEFRGIAAERGLHHR